MSVKVLAIDDSRTMLGLVRKVMNDAGFDCVSAEDGEKGLEVFSREAPDVVITDINMPKMDGYGVINAIRSRQALVVYRPQVASAGDGHGRGCLFAHHQFHHGFQHGWPA
jgi:CheY-like chemotaxis protein